MEARREILASRTTTDDATATAPLIVNGLTARPREKINLWQYGICLLPDFAALLVIAGLGMRWLLRYLDAREEGSKATSNPFESTSRFDKK